MTTAWSIITAALVVLTSAGPLLAQPTPAAEPGAVPEAAPAPAIRVDRGRVGIPPGSDVTINVSGTIGPLTVQPSFDGVDAAYDPRTHRLLVSGRAPGSGTIALTDRSGNTASIAVLVAPPAGSIPADVDVALAGTVSAPFVAARIREAVERALVREPGTALDVHGVTLPATLAPGDTLDAQAGVTLDGRGAYVDVSARTNVHVHVDPEPPLAPGLLFYSDDPEYVRGELAGVLFRGTIDLQTPARMFVYHVADGAPRRLSLVLSAGGTTHVQVLGSVGGPSPAFAYIGQQSSARFLAEEMTGESSIVTVAGGVPYEVPLGLQQPGDLIEAILDLRVLDGGPLGVAVVTKPPGTPLPPLDGAELPGDSHGRRGVFPLTDVAPLELSFAGGGPEPAPVAVGDAALANQRDGGRPLGGDYGVVYPLALHLANPTPDPLTVYLYELTSGAGGATATLWFTGDPAATLVPCVDDAVQPHLVKAFTLAAGETRTVTGSFMTDGAASYPIRFGLSATQPLPPGAAACRVTPPPPAP